MHTDFLPGHQSRDPKGMPFEDVAEIYLDTNHDHIEMNYPAASCEVSNVLHSPLSLRDIPSLARERGENVHSRFFCANSPPSLPRLL